jgi:hypothetical protein
MQKDMWSGWGIRTLSSDHPSFNPYNYQTGAVWPHDNSLIALGMRRYGFDAEAAALARDISGAAGHFLLNQLPELYAGLQRDPTGFPVQYLGANVPQAWAAGTPFALLQAMLGLQQDAPRGKLYVDPALPAWLPDMTLIDLRLGRRRFDIRFWRDGKETLFEVLRGKGSAVERRLNFAKIIRNAKHLRDCEIVCLGLTVPNGDRRLPINASKNLQKSVASP